MKPYTVVLSLPFRFATTVIKMMALDEHEAADTAVKWNRPCGSTHDDVLCVVEGHPDNLVEGLPC